MALTPGLDLRQTQRLALTPGLRQGMAVLQLSTLELWDELRRLADENPLLELHEPAAGPAAFNVEAATRPETLAETLCTQIALMALPPETAALARFLTGDLTEEGYLASPAGELSEALGLPLAAIEAAIAALQSCEPAGVAARDLPECLALQLVDRGEAPEAARAACAHLGLLMEGRFARAARLTGLPRPELERLTGIIRGLPPRPAAHLSEAAPPVLPEIAVEEDGQGGFRAVSLRDALPSLQLDAALAARAGAAPPRAHPARRRAGDRPAPAPFLRPGPRPHGAADPRRDRGRTGPAPLHRGARDLGQGAAVPRRGASPVDLRAAGAARRGLGLHGAAAAAAADRGRTPRRAARRRADRRAFAARRR